MSLVATQNCNYIDISWTAPENQTCPITGYMVSIPGVLMPRTTNDTSYTHSVNNNSFCGKTVEVYVSAISAAGTSNATSTSITYICTCEGNERVACDTNIVSYLLGVKIFCKN